MYRQDIAYQLGSTIHVLSIDPESEHAGERSASDNSSDLCDTTDHVSRTKLVRIESIEHTTGILSVVQC